MRSCRSPGRNGLRRPSVSARRRLGRPRRRPGRGGGRFPRPRPHLEPARSARTRPAAQASQMDRTIGGQRRSSGPRRMPSGRPTGRATRPLARSPRLATWRCGSGTPTPGIGVGPPSSFHRADRIAHLAEPGGGALADPVILVHDEAVAVAATVAVLPTIIGSFTGPAAAPSSCSDVPKSPRTLGGRKASAVL